MSITPDFTEDAAELVVLVRLPTCTEQDAIALVRAHLGKAFAAGGVHGLQMAQAGIERAFAGAEARSLS